MLALVIGGSGSGKSALAEGLMVALGAEKKYYLATMAVADAESQRRVQRHRKMRRGKGFETVECPVGLENVCLPLEGDVLLECMSNLAANESFMPKGCRTKVCEHILAGVEALKRQARHVVIVTNNVFEDGRKYDAETENYLDVLNEINCRLAASADLVMESMAGVPIVLKGNLPENMSLEQESEKMDMILITGGSGQEKLAWACEKRNLSQDSVFVYNGERGWPDSMEQIQVLDKVHELVKQALLQGKPLDSLAEQLAGPDRILILDEVGCGLVPMDPFERQYREAVGRLGEQLAKKASEVYRMSCGLAQKLK